MKNTIVINIIAHVTLSHPGMDTVQEITYFKSRAAFILYSNWGVPKIVDHKKYTL